MSTESEDKKLKTPKGKKQPKGDVKIEQKKTPSEPGVLVPLTKAEVEASYREARKEERESKIPPRKRMLEEQADTFPDRPLIDLMLDRDAGIMRRIQLDIESKMVEIRANIYDIGELLHEAKEIVGHGLFKRWIKETFGPDLPYNTAVVWKAIYEKFQGKPNVVKYLPVTLLQQMKQPKIPEDLLKEIEANPGDWSHIDVVAFKEYFAAFKQGKLNIHEFMKLAEKEKELGLEIAYGQARKRRAERARKTVNVGLEALKNAILNIRQYTDDFRAMFPGTLAQDQELIKGIDGCIEDLQKAIDAFKKFKAEVEDKTRIMPPGHLVEGKNGVIRHEDEKPKEPSDQKEPESSDKKEPPEKKG